MDFLFTQEAMQLYFTAVSFTCLGYCIGLRYRLKLRLVIINMEYDFAQRTGQFSRSIEKVIETYKEK
jgi:hypothetical protein